MRIPSGFEWNSLTGSLDYDMSLVPSWADRIGLHKSNWFSVSELLYQHNAADRLFAARSTTCGCNVWECCLVLKPDIPVGITNMLIIGLYPEHILASYEFVAVK